MSRNTERTLAALRNEGLYPWMVERFIPMKPHGKRVDLYHIIDIIAIKPGLTVGVQACGQDFAAHDRKITIEYAENATSWLLAGNELQLWGWSKKCYKLSDGKRSKAKRWTPRVKIYTLNDFYEGLSK